MVNWFYTMGAMEELGQVTRMATNSIQIYNKDNVDKIKIQSTTHAEGMIE